MKIVIESLAYEAPQRVCTSLMIEERLAPLYASLGLAEGRLELMTGIHERRFWDNPGEKPSVGATRAALKLGDQLEGVDALLYAGVCRDGLEPATAAYVHQQLKLPQEAFFLDVSSACLGFINAIYVAKSLIASGAKKRVLIVASENGESLLENTLHLLLNTPQTRQTIKPYFANLTIGAGACAMVVASEKALRASPVAELGAIHFQNDTSSVHLCEGQQVTLHGAPVYNMVTDSEALLHAGLRLAKSCWSGFLEKASTAGPSFGAVLAHQVGKQHAGLYEAIGVGLEKSHFTYPEWGNVGSVSLPLTLACFLEKQSNFESPIALLGIGSGLSAMMAELLPVNGTAS
jgi:3-oxoacyl-[acyl-carrier-protein] synthase III